MSEKIVGRAEEKAILKKIYASLEAEFVAVYGRRRVGKTFLVRKFFESLDCWFFQVTGIHNGSLKQHLMEFKKELENLYRQVNLSGIGLKTPDSWLEAFDMLTQFFVNFGQPGQKFVIFFDELPWMATRKSQLLHALDYYWNRYWVNQAGIKLIVCGSAASWIIEKILNNKAGLHNRVTQKLAIEPFSLKETRAYLSSRDIVLSDMQITHLYMCVGGIPYYLRGVSKGLSAVQNINAMCFSKRGMLFNEFENLFASLFSNAQIYERVIRMLAERRRGVLRVDLEKALDMKGGALSRVLRELEFAGFIAGFLPWGQKKGMRYCLVDEYCLFYLRWIQPSSNSGFLHELDDQFWSFKGATASWHAWSGYAFEAVCFKHLSSIKKALNIPSSAVATSWSCREKPGVHCGAQIDLVFHRQDGITNLCEIKYTGKEFLIDKGYAENLRKKMAIYHSVTRTKDQLVLSFVTSVGLAESKYRQGLVWSETTLAQLFE